MRGGGEDDVESDRGEDGGGLIFAREAVIRMAQVRGLSTTGTTGLEGHCGAQISPVDFCAVSIA